MKRTATPTFVLSIPLVVKPGEDRILIGRMEAGRRLYNATLGEALRRHGLLKQSKDWQHTRTIADKKLRSDEFKRLSKEAGFTPAAIITFARTCKNEAGWKDRLGSNVTQRIAEQVFAAMQQYAFGKRGRPRFKGASRPLHSLEATTNAANIIWKPETGCIEFGDLTLPALLPSKTQDPYLHQALTNKTKYCRVLWRVVSGSRRWFVQLMQEGIAPAKHEQACGEIVGLDIGPSTVAVVGDNSASLVKFCDTVVQPWKETRRLQRAMDRSKRATNPLCFNANGTWKKGQKFTPSKRYTAIRTEYAEVERKLAAERKRAHGELANQILGLGNVVQSETLSYIAFQKNYGKSVKVRAPGMFVEQLRRKAESAGGQLIDLHTWSLKMSQYDHTTGVFTKKPLSQRWHVLGDGSGVVQRDVYSAFLARCVMSNTHHPSHIETMWAAQKPVLLQTGWLRSEPAKIEPSGKITVATPLEQVVCDRGFAAGHGLDAVVARREPGDPSGFALRTPCL
ncbi:transposase [Ferrovum myxofaciens]|uniref:transposase n=1 Tax=Ferrovum myxofaciens TaxID=416213 RepID=UPI003EBCC3EA